LTRRSKRELTREVDNLRPEDDDTGAGLVLNLTNVVDTSPHPELTVQPWPEAKPQSRKIAVPKVIPEKFSENIIIVEMCGDKAPRGAGGDKDGLFACDLWEELTDEQLREEYEIRQAENDPIPEYLANRVSV